MQYACQPVNVVQLPRQYEKKTKENRQNTRNKRTIKVNKLAASECQVDKRAGHFDSLWEQAEARQEESD
jgi:hypothetical protein